MNNRAISISVMSVILFALSINLGGCTMSSGVKKDMEEYLRVTYEKEFFLKSEPRLVGGSWVFPATTYVSRDAYPADDPELTFDISWDTKERTYKDSYLSIRWTREGRKVIEQKLREVYEEGAFFIDRYRFFYNFQEDQKFTWAEVMKNRSEYNRIDFNYFIFVEGVLDREKEAKRAYKLLKENFIDYKLMQYNFIVYFIYSHKKKECLDIWTGKGSRSHEGADKMHKAGILKDWIRVNYAKVLAEKYSHDILEQEIKSAEDLLKTRFQIKEGK